LTSAWFFAKIIMLDMKNQFLINKLHFKKFTGGDGSRQDKIKIAATALPNGECLNLFQEF
jgi:hypothetical protein